ncbi:hypothetical protein [Terrabacter terrigena]|uniref:Uncharacterized protein n=1 Tax=Terrabacter terrigena TaxID=574718 RepID=A0ABW3MVP1_9MICO
MNESHDDDALDELVEAVFRLHLALVADPARNGVGMPRGPGGTGSLRRAFEDDSTRLRHLLEDVTRHHPGTPASA